MGQTFEVKTWNISISSHLHENSGSSKFELPICASGNPGSSKFELPGFAKQRIFQKHGSSNFKFELLGVSGMIPLSSYGGTSSLKPKVNRTLVDHHVNEEIGMQVRRSDQLRYPIHNRSFVAHGGI